MTYTVLIVGVAIVMAVWVYALHVLSKPWRDDMESRIDALPPMKDAPKTPPIPFSE